MATRKDSVIIALATFCLAATLFTVMPTRSQNSKYDPWLDTNDDGTINILDLSASAVAYGSSGDPAKNVSVTGFDPNCNMSSFSSYSWHRVGTMNFSASGYSPTGQTGVDIVCGGYSRMVISIEPVSISGFTQDISVTFSLFELMWQGAIGSYAGSCVERYYWNPEHSMIGIQNITVSVMNGRLSMVDISNAVLIEIKGPVCHPNWFVTATSTTPPANWSITFDVYAYLRNE